MCFTGQKEESENKCLLYNGRWPGRRKLAGIAGFDKRSLCSVFCYSELKHRDLELYTILFYLEHSVQYGTHMWLFTLNLNELQLNTLESYMSTAQ